MKTKISRYQKHCIELRLLRELFKQEPTNNLIAKKIKRLDKILKKVDASVGRFTTPGGNYNKAL